MSNLYKFKNVVRIPIFECILISLSSNVFPSLIDLIKTPYMICLKRSQLNKILVAPWCSWAGYAVAGLSSGVFGFPTCSDHFGVAGCHHRYCYHPTICSSAPAAFHSLGLSSGLHWFWAREAAPGFLECICSSIWIQNMYSRIFNNSTAGNKSTATQWRG